MIVSNSFPLGVLFFLYWLVKQIALPKTSAIGWATFAYCLYCCAKAKDCNFYLGRKWVISIFGRFKTSFIMCISILSQLRCFSEKIMGALNRNFENPWRNQGRTPYNTSYRSFTLFGILKMKLRCRLGVIWCSAFSFLLSIKIWRI